ncbi:hypothetical protein GUJ93_ZPchr0002g24867 [Zizania palustris]|uniref:Secreted protein n=1 Tax=Zizania palustris TaxID=103762 RepID=A0A8J5S8N7_ZIZPA|nr:hypothetical protein GUJ93_ZPchr0002g24867 [Zizania palustris]
MAWLLRHSFSGAAAILVCLSGLSSYGGDRVSDADLAVLARCRAASASVWAARCKLLGFGRERITVDS